MTAAKKNLATPKRAPAAAKVRKRQSAADRSLSPFSQAKRDQIVKAALDTFLSHGYEGTSMSLVAERANVIKQTIYSHFHDKESLFRVVVENLTIDHFKDAIDENRFQGLSPRQALTVIAEIIVVRQSNPSYIRLMRTIIGESSRFPELAHLYVDSVIKPGLKYVTAFLQSHPEIPIEDDEAFARIFCGSIVNYCMVQNILYGKQTLPFEFKRLLQTLLDLAFQSRPESRSFVRESGTKRIGTRKRLG
jgi:AcrR family transcriptional regulator